MNEFLAKWGQWIAGGFVLGLLAWGANTYAVASHEKRLDRVEGELSDLKGVAADVRTIKAIVLKRLGSD